MGYHHTIYAESKIDTQPSGYSSHVNAVYADMQFEKRLAKLAAIKAAQDKYRQEHKN